MFKLYQNSQSNSDVVYLVFGLRQEKKENLNPMKNKTLLDLAQTIQLGSQRDMT